MAPHRPSSPFPTSHDTLGLSTLNTPLDLASSPPRIGNHSRRLRTRSKKSISFGPTSTTPGRRSSGNAAVSSDGSDSETNLSDYTFDLDKLPGDSAGIDNTKDEGDKRSGREAGEPGDDNSSDLDGPEDFTLNMVELIRGGATNQRQDDADKLRSNTKDQEEEQGNTVLPEEYSQFEPPLDMSTPAQVHSRRISPANKEAAAKFAHQTRTLREGSSSIAPVAEEPDNEEDDGLYIEVERLRRELRQKDEIIKANERRVLDAVSVSQQVRHLQSQLRKQKEDFDRQNATHREQVHQLEMDLEFKERQLGDNRAEMEKMKSLRGEAVQQMMRREDNEDHQSELSLLRFQLAEKDKTLNRTLSKLRETTTAHEAQLQERSAEIDRLKSQRDEQHLELDKLDSDLDSVSREREALLQRTADLDKTVQHIRKQLESATLELSSVKSEKDSGMDALKSLASELSIATDGRRFSEIIDSLKSVYLSNRNEGGRVQAEYAGQKQDQSDLIDLREQLRESTSLIRILTLQLESTKEELSEAKSFYTAVRSENAQLKSETEKVKASQSELRQRLDTATKTDQPSPSAGSRWKTQQIDDAARLSYQTELSNIQSSHAKSLAAIQQSHTETTRYLQTLIKDAQQREAELRAEIVSLKTRSSTGYSELAVLKSERDRLEATLESKEATAAAADVKFANLLKKREEVWEARVERLLSDRERMGKVLMWTWGEKEVGERDRRTGGASKSENRQGYKYKYVSKAMA